MGSLLPEVFASRNSWSADPSRSGLPRAVSLPQPDEYGVESLEDARKSRGSNGPEPVASDVHAFNAGVQKDGVGGFQSNMEMITMYADVIRRHRWQVKKSLRCG